MNRSHAALAVLFIVGLFNNIDRSLLSILQVPIKKDLNLSDSQLGMLTGFSFAIVYALVLLPMGRMVDRYRRTWLLAGALALWTLLTAASGFARGFGTLLLCRLGVAFGEAAGNPASYSLLADYFPPEKRGRAFAVFAVAPFLGVFVGIFAGGFLAADLGWRTSFLVVGLFGLLIVPLLLWLPEPKRGQQEADQASFAEEPPPLGQAMKELFAMPAFRWLVFGMTCHSFVTAAYLNLPVAGPWPAACGGRAVGGIADRHRRRDRCARRWVHRRYHDPAQSRLVWLGHGDRHPAALLRRGGAILGAERSGLDRLQLPDRRADQLLPGRRWWRPPCGA